MKIRASKKLNHKRNIIILSVVGAVAITSGVSAYYISIAPQSPKPAVVQQEQQIPESSLTPSPSVDPTKTEAVDEPTVSTSPSPSASATPSLPPNPYAKNTSMGYVYDRRQKVGKLVGAWGLPTSWAGLAREAGATVDHIPEKDAIVLPSTGNVGIVDSVDDSSFTYSGYSIGGELTSWTIPISNQSAYTFVH